MQSLLVLIHRAAQGLTSSHYAESPVALQNLTVAYNAVGIVLNGAASAAPLPNEPEDIPNRDCLLQWLQAQIVTIAGGASSIDWFLAIRSDGGLTVTPVFSTAIVLEPGSVVVGSIFGSIRDGGQPFVRTFPGGTAEGVVGVLYLFAKVDVGTADILGGAKLGFTGATATSVS